MNYYTCSNKDPDLDGPITKSNFSFLAMTSILLHLFVKLRITWYQRKKQTKEELTPKIWICPKSEVQNHVEIQSIPDFTTSVIGICIFISYSTLAERMNSMTVLELNTSPNHILMNFFQLICPCLMTCAISSLYYYMHPLIRRTLLRELKNTLLHGNWKEISFYFECLKLSQYVF